MDLVFLHIYILFPILILLNNIFLHRVEALYEWQRPLNNVLYFVMLVASIFFLTQSNIQNQQQMSFVIENFRIGFIFNTFNFVFATFFNLIFFFLNWQFQKSMKLLNAYTNYTLYNQQISYIFYLSFLLIFTHNMLLVAILYMSIVFCSLLLLYNPDLKDIKKKYASVFIFGISEGVILLIATAFFYSQTSRTNFYRYSDIFHNYSVSILFLLILLVNFFYPIYKSLQEKIFYEDLLPIYIITFVPFILINTFLFLKIFYYVFSLNTNILFFYWMGYAVILAFLLSLYPLIKNFRNNRKFIILYSYSVFLIFLSHVLFIQNKEDFIITYLNFMYIVMIITADVLSLVSITFYMLKCIVNETSLIYRTQKKELRFHLFCMFFLIITLLVSFFNSNFAIFHFIHLLNLAEMLILFTIFCIYTYYCIYIKPIKEKELMQITKKDKQEEFLVAVIFTVVSAILLCFRGYIVDFIKDKI